MRKNCEPPVFGWPVLAMLRLPRKCLRRLRQALLVGNVVPRAAAAGAFGIAALRHEQGQHAVKSHAVVVSTLHERDEVRHRLRRFVLEQLDDDVAFAGGELDPRQIVGRGFGSSNLLLRVPMFAVLGQAL